jgi:hypothetical protein
MAQSYHSRVIEDDPALAAGPERQGCCVIASDSRRLGLPVTAGAGEVAWTLGCCNLLCCDKGMVHDRVGSCACYVL